MKKFLIILTTAMMPHGAIAQGNQVDFSVIYDTTTGLNQFYDSTCQVTVSINTSELSQLERIYIKMGSLLGKSDLFALAFYRSTLEQQTFDPQHPKEQYLSWQGNQLHINLGIHPLRRYYLEIYTKDSAGNYIPSLKIEP